MREWIRNWLVLPSKNEIERALDDCGHRAVMARQKGYTDSSLKREVDKQLRELDIEHLVGNLAMGVVADKIINIAGRTALSEIRDAAATAARAELDTHVTTVEDYVHSPEFVEETIAAINKFQLKG